MIKKILAIFSIVVLILLGTAGFYIVGTKVVFRPELVYTGGPPQKVLIVHDSSDQGGEQVYGQTLKALDYARITYQSLDLSKTRVFCEPKQREEDTCLEEYTSVLFVTENVGQLAEQESLDVQRYVEKGGGLAVLYRAWNPFLRETMGVLNPDEPQVIQSAAGVRFEKDLFPGVEGLELEEGELGEFSSLAPISLKEVELVAFSTGDDVRPLVWERQYGKGRVLFWNTDWMAHKVFRGFIVQSLLSVQEAGMASVANVATFQIEGFPPPPAETQVPGTSEVPGTLSPAEFYRQVWYPDMVAWSTRYNVHYTWPVAFSYNDRVTPPFDDFSDWTKPEIELNAQMIPLNPYLSRLASQRRDEMALAGYNHQPLRQERWGEVNNMVAALEAARQRWQMESLGALPVSYVPPGGAYDEAGLRALLQVFPSMKVVAGTGFGSFDQGGDREFGPEPWNEALFDVPRWSEGYVLDGPTRLRILSELGLFGVWTHAIRSDEIFQVPDTSWRGDEDDPDDGLGDRFEALLNFVHGNYPWLDHLTTEGAYQRLETYLSGGEVTYRVSKPYVMTVSFTGVPSCIVVRFNDGRRLDISTIKFAQLLYFYNGEDYNLYVIRALDREISFEVLLPSLEF